MIRAAAVLAVLLAPARAAADTGPTRAAEAGGVHYRLDTAHGPVHVWVPPGYRSETAGVALYVHGYYTSVDRAWTEHRLAEQFRASGSNALFIAPEAPAGLAPAVNWPVLGELLVEVRRQTGLRRPWGPVVAVFHSGAFRTAVEWLEDPDLHEIVMLDALYDGEDSYLAWLTAPQGAALANRIVLVGADTLRWTEPFARDARDAGLTVRETSALPARAGDVDDEARTARLLYVRAGEAHMDLVTDGAAIPLLLALTRLAPAGEAAP